MVVPKALQAQAIVIAHGGHMQMDGTLWLLRESQWFRDMRSQVQAYMDFCKCATAVPRNGALVDYKGQIGPHKWYLHTQMDLYTRYPDVHMTKSTGMMELKKVPVKTMRTHGRPKEIWSDIGPPYNGHKWVRWHISGATNIFPY